MVLDKLLVATGNPNKLREIKEIFGPLCPVEAAAAAGKTPHVIEDGKTFADNAQKKAIAAARALGLWVMADDSGLEVDALGGMPGVYSARFAGEPCDDRRNNEKLLALLATTPLEQRGARFRCVMALAAPDERVWLTEGNCQGYIVVEPGGTNGFGYDPLFYVREYEATFAQLTPEQKNRISHRRHALEAMKKVVQGLPSC